MEKHYFLKYIKNKKKNIKKKIKYLNQLGGDGVNISMYQIAMYKLKESLTNLQNLYKTNIEYYNNHLIDFLSVSLSELESSISSSLNTIRQVGTLDYGIPINQYDIPKIKEIIDSNEYFKVLINNEIAVVAEPINTTVLREVVTEMTDKIKAKSSEFTESLQENISGVTSKIKEDCDEIKVALDSLKEYGDQIDRAIESFNDIIDECTSIESELNKVQPHKPDLTESMITNEDNNEDDLEDDEYIFWLVNKTGTTEDTDYMKLKNNAIYAESDIRVVRDTYNIKTGGMIGGILSEVVKDNTRRLYTRILDLSKERKESQKKNEEEERQKTTSAETIRNNLAYLKYLSTNINVILTDIMVLPDYDLITFLDSLDLMKTIVKSKSANIKVLHEQFKSKLQFTNENIIKKLNELLQSIEKLTEEDILNINVDVYRSNLKNIFDIKYIIDLFLLFLKFSISYLNINISDNNFDKISDKIIGKKDVDYNKTFPFGGNTLYVIIKQILFDLVRLDLKMVSCRGFPDGTPCVTNAIEELTKTTNNLEEMVKRMKIISWYFLLNNDNIILKHFGKFYRLKIKNFNNFTKQYSPPQTQSGGNNIKEFNKWSSMHINYIKDINKMHISLSKKAKRFNLRYFQLYHYINHVRTYKLQLIENKKNSYYNFLYQGNISFFDTLLTNLVEDIKNLENPAKSHDRKLVNTEIKRHYTIYYFQIKILQIFFRKLYKFWNKKNWTLSNTILCINEKCPVMTDLFSLFNSFSKILFEYYNNNMPAVANYLRINKLPNDGKREPEQESFVKDDGNKHFLTNDNLKNCVGDSKQHDNVSQIKFQEIFDPDKFPQNDSIPYYMGLADFINKGKSIMILTYGYSGVGKTFTLFGRAATEGRQSEPSEASGASGAPAAPEPSLPIFGKGMNGGSPSIKGMLQSTLEQLGSGIDIKVKIFELYGLGVPYKFYWQDPKKVCHYIYAYTCDFVKNTTTCKEKTSTEFHAYLNIDNDNEYANITPHNIKNFEKFIEAIDDIRKTHGRIKATLNNPESSRSIMIYDFKIKLKKDNENDEDKYSHFVIMDLPGKEDIYTTFCETDDPKYTIKEGLLKCKKIELNNTDTDIINNHLSKSHTLNAPIKSSNTGAKYDKTLIKKMLFANPLFLSMIPEFAEMFEPKYLKVKNLFTNQLVDIEQNKKPDGEHEIEINRWTTQYNPKQRVFTNSYLPQYHTHYIYIKDVNDISLVAPNTHSSQDAKTDYSYTKGQVLGSDGKFHNNVSDVTVVNKSLITNGLTYLRVMGLFERSLHNMVTIIKKHDLEKLGGILNDMLEPDDDDVDGQKRRGYAGLEGIYINENILGLLQVLADKVQDTRERRHVPICCEQIENYKDKLLADHANFQLRFKSPADETNNNKLLSSSNFFSQIDYLNESQKLVLGNKDHHDAYKTRKEYMDQNKSGKQDDGKFNLEYIRTVDKGNVYDNVFRYPLTAKYLEFEEDIKNYDYNRIFNIKNPPIKTILEPYLTKINNYYLFFVVSNNFKLDSDGTKKETCHNQINLLNDTRFFMNIINGENINGRMQCDP